MFYKLVFFCLGSRWIKFSLFVVAIVDRDKQDKCTSIGTGAKATIDDSIITTHNADCMECDFRITRVPSYNWPKGSLRPIYDIRSVYPRYVETSESNIHGPDYLNTTIDFRIFNWSVSKAFFFIPQILHTYAYILGEYGIQNEKQVSIGESTCGAVFFASPIFSPGGKAALHMGVLTEIALERCDTARCALQTMGDLAVKYGFYGPSWDVSAVEGQSEAGEALIVADTTETWMFHILPDDTGASAVWVARRVPDGHITAVANQFVITEIDFDDSANYLYSANIVAVAVRNNLWANHSTSSVISVNKGDGLRYNRPFNFLQVYGQNIHSSAYQATRRIWRVFTLASPSLLPVFSAYTDSMGSFGYGANGTEPYPFSVQVDKLLSVRDVMAMNRDQYEGTPFDMSTGMDAGRFGDPVRFRPVSAATDPLLGVTIDQYNKGLMYNRAISIARTSYSTVTQSRGDVPEVLGALTWVAQYAPHHSSFVPVYVHCAKTPESLKNGTLHKMERGSQWWAHAVTGNYLSRWYRETIGDVRAFQSQLEGGIFERQAVVEAQALAVLSQSDLTSQEKTAAVVALLTDLQESVSSDSLTQWWSFFDLCVVRYRDMYRVRETRVDNIADAMDYLTLPRLWYEVMGYWGPPFTPPPQGSGSGGGGGDGSSDISSTTSIEDSTSSVERLDPIYPVNIPTEPSLIAYHQRYPKGMTAPYTAWTSPFVAPATPSAAPSAHVPIPHLPQEESYVLHGITNNWVSMTFIVVLSVLFGITVGVILAPLLPQNNFSSYMPIR